MPFFVTSFVTVIDDRDVNISSPLIVFQNLSIVQWKMVDVKVEVSCTLEN